MDQFLELQNASLWMLPWATFLAGLAGSLHCIGMCGALSGACQSSPQSQVSYQAGRLFSYIILGLVASSFIGIVEHMGIKKELSLIPAFLLGVFLILNGLNLYKNGSNEKSLTWLSKISEKLIGHAFKIQILWLRSFLIGLFTLFLPCGLLYTVLAGVISFQHSPIAIISMLTFWLGTLPALFASSWIFMNLLKPLANYSKGLSSFVLIFLGLSTIFYRLMIVYGDGHVTCH